MNKYLLATLSVVFVLGSCDFSEAQLFRRRARNQAQNYSCNYNYQPANYDYQPAVQQANYYQPTFDAATFPIQQAPTNAMSFPVQQASFNVGAQPGFDPSLPFNPHDVGYMGPGTMRDHLWSEHSGDLQARGISQASLVSMSAPEVQSLHNQFHGVAAGSTGNTASFNQPMQQPMYQQNMIQQSMIPTTASSMPMTGEYFTSQPVVSSPAAISYAIPQEPMATFTSQPSTEVMPSSMLGTESMPAGMQSPSNDSRATYELEPGETLMWEQPIEGRILTPAEASEFAAQQEATTAPAATNDKAPQ